MLIYQGANLSRHSINLQLNGVVLGVHVDVADGKTDTGASHSASGSHPAVLILVINSVILTDQRSSR